MEVKKVVWKFIRKTKSEFIFLKLASFNSSFRKFIPRHYFYPGEKRVIIRDNIRYKLDLSDYTQWKIFSYNRDTGAKLAFQLLNKTSIVVLDIGSNVGEFSLKLTSQILKTAKELTLYMFEPNPITYNTLLSNLSLNNFPQRIKLHPFNIGLGAGRDTMKLNVVAGHSGAASLLNEGGNTIVEVWPLDDFMKSRAINSIDFIKIDVECFEPFVLKGSNEIIKKFRPFIYVEHQVSCNKMHKMGEDFVYQFLVTNGYYITFEMNGMMVPISDFSSLKAMGKVDILAIPLESKHSLELLEISQALA